ncbi:Arc family DNA-binding protein [Uliginosibacterium paludis]|jgi:plasmid stability protein|uniref:Arc family DNA-binding protein n=1 Tax=Uliginosibacterium paludis TaxID=1615952 RepID=A0ABV2CSI8_9RHOO
MPHLTLRDVPEELHGWLKQQALAHRRSLNQEVITQLDALRQKPATEADPAARLARIRQIAQRSASLPVQDARSEADILGLSAEGIPQA